MDKTEDVTSASLYTDTEGSSEYADPDGRVAVPALTILYHPDLSKVGLRTRMPSLAAGRSVRLSRLEPDFGSDDAPSSSPIGSRFLSRQPIVLSSSQGGVRVDPAATSMPVVYRREPLTTPRVFGAEDLQRGVVLTIAKRLVVLLHYLAPPSLSAVPSLGLVGASDAIVRLRKAILHVADLDVPVMLRGETGTGKELAARAIHSRSRRRHRDHVSVNMAAIPPTLAASELFGYSKGAFSGADRAKEGFFEKADGGTLFLDEIGEAPVDVQVMLLRVLETGEIQRVGARDAQTVDVRLVTATDANLDAMIREGSFRAPLLHRLAGYEIHVPPLRERRDDIARLFYHFVHQELAVLGAEHRLDRPDKGQRPWLPASLAAELCDMDWPGNVRQLRNVARQIVISNRDAPYVSMDPATQQVLEGARGARESEPEPAPRGGRRLQQPSVPPRDLSEDEIIRVLKRHSYRIVPTAAELGVSRKTLYSYIDKSDRIRKARDIPQLEIENAIDRAGGDMDQVAQILEVSKRGILLRMNQLGMKR